MVSRRNYFTMGLTMLILFFMFQFTGMAKNVLNEYGSNEYEESVRVQLNAGSEYQMPEQPLPGDAEDVQLSAGDIWEERPYILFVGDGRAGEIRQVVSWWCTYTKRGFEACNSLSEYQLPEEGLPQAVVIDGENLDIREAMPVLEEMAERGVHMIFARLPEPEVLEKNRRFREFLGIREVYQESVEIDGIHLFKGFLLGDEKIYESKPDDEENQKMMDLDLEIPWYMTGSGTKTYIMGMVGEKDEYENEDLPAILWRKSVGNAKVFCVNADYLSHMYGMGFLNAMLAETDVFEIHPVVNAQNFSVVNFSAFADENESELMRLYSESQVALYRELVWPGLVSVNYKSGSKFSLFVSPQLDYGDGIEPDVSNLTYYLKLLKEQHGEMGVSLDAVSAISPAEKLSRDRSFYEEGAGEYDILSLYIKDMADLEEIRQDTLLSKLRTVALIPEREGPMIGYADENITYQHATALAEEHTFTDDLALMGLETAIGYSNIVLELKNVSFPASSDYYWENLARTVSRNITTYWKPYDCFANTTLTESDARVRSFLALDFRAWMQGDRITLQKSNVEGPAWFLLKLNGRTIKQMEGGTFEGQGGGYYLIELEGQEAVIELEVKQVKIYE